MNKTYIDQIVRYMNLAKIKNQNEYDDVAMANGAMQWFIEALEKRLGNCHGVKDGKCQFYWKHDECVALMGLLLDFTGDQKYNYKSHKYSLWD